MTGFELVNLYYEANLKYLEHHSDRFNRLHVLFLLGLIETAYIVNPLETSPKIPEFLDAN